VLAVWLRPLVDYLERTGYDSAEVFRYTGVDVGQVFVPGVRLPLKNSAPLWQRAAQVTGKPFIGLEIASDASPLHADVTTIAMMASRNLYEALQRFTRLSRIVTEAVDVVLTREGEALRLDFIVKASEQQFMPPESMDPALLIPLGLLGKGMIAPGAIVELRFARPRPEEAVLTHLTELFPIPMRFECEHHGMSFRWDMTLQQNPYWNPALAQMCEEQVLRELEALDEELEALDDSNLVARTRKILLDHLGSGTPQLKMVASLFNITERQLQRKLKEQGTTFGELLDEVRLDLALRYLQDPRMGRGAPGPCPALPAGPAHDHGGHRPVPGLQGETPGQYRRRGTA
jgi:AraC-like DNA-binding protein